MREMSWLIRVVNGQVVIDAVVSSVLPLESTEEKFHATCLLLRSPTSTTEVNAEKNLVQVGPDDGRRWWEVCGDEQQLLVVVKVRVYTCRYSFEPIHVG